LLQCCCSAVLLVRTHCYSAVAVPSDVGASVLCCAVLCCAVLCWGVACAVGGAPGGAAVLGGRATGAGALLCGV